MKISELTEKLTDIKNKKGDLEVLLDLKNIEEGMSGEYTHEDEISLNVQKILTYDADKGMMIPNSHRPVLALGIDL